MNKKLLVIIGAILGSFLIFAIVIASWFFKTSNRFVVLEEGIKGQRSQLENTYQRRADLIPNLVNTVKGYAKHESEVFIKVSEARAQVGKQSGNIAASEKAQGELSSALSRLLVVAERYPELKADRQFLELQSQLEGTENRITIERQRWIETIKEFNIAVKIFPGSFVAGIRGITPKDDYFVAQEGSEKAPQVDFSK